MTKKDYELIAGAIHRSGMGIEKNAIRRQAGEKMRRLIATDLAASLKAENPRFNPDRFMKACGFMFF